ncbi:MAG: prolyl aminopeptidase [bacterium]
MKGLYPAIKPYVQHQLKVDGRHTLHIEECGNPAGLPVVFLHGGPGGGCDPMHRRFFDPEIYRIILFDQRGCGRSTPHADLVDNTTQHLVADIEAIRELLEIERWLVFGGSWGSTLALVYAQTHPEHVTGLILRGIFLCRDHEIEWFYQQGASRLFPDQWEKYLEPVKETERDDMLSAYYALLTGEDELKRMAAAKAWSVWEGSTATLLPSRQTVQHFADPHVALSMARIECHYFVNHAFLAPNQILDNMDKLATIPGMIVHGRYDVICPAENAWQLHKAWPGSELQIIADAGHSATEKGITAALVAATDRFAMDQL